MQSTLCSNFKCKGIVRIEDSRDRRKWVRKQALKWKHWDSLAASEWVIIEKTGRLLRRATQSA